MTREELLAAVIESFKLCEELLKKLAEDESELIKYLNKAYPLES